MASTKKIGKATTTVVAWASEENAVQLPAVATYPLLCNWSATQPGEHCALEKSISKMKAEKMAFS